MNVTQIQSPLVLPRRVRWPQHLFLLPCLLLFSVGVYAMPAAGTAALPWDAPLALLVTSITGPFAFAAASIGMVIAGAILVFGNDLNRFGQSVMYLILVIGLIVLGVNGLAALFTTGAVVGSSNTLFVVVSFALVALAIGLSAIQYLLVKAVRQLQRNKGSSRKMNSHSINTATA